MITDKITEFKDKIENTLLKESAITNIGKTERILSIASGTYIFLKGARNIFSNPLLATGELVVGFGLLRRGVSGYSATSEKLEREETIVETITVNKIK
jgi:hypothetical protein